MHEYEIKMIVEGHNTKVKVQAYSGAEARSIAESQYPEGRYLSCRRVD